MGCLRITDNFQYFCVLTKMNQALHRMTSLTYFFTFSLLVLRVGGVCYFSQEQQGVYLTQSVVEGGGHTVQYLELTVMPDSIPVWGDCYKRLGNNVLLYDGTGGTDCVRCFHLSVRSPHVLEVHTESLNKCYTNEDAALQTCPTREHIRTRRTREIMLYKTSPLTASPPPAPVYCPINGRYRYTYNQEDGTETAAECAAPTSRLSNCPSGNVLTLEFRQCSFEDFEKVFDCLGDWQGSDGQRYLALRDSASQNVTGRPQYRCAMYSIEKPSGRVYLSLSSDSTCVNNLISPWKGYETLALNPITQPPPPTTVSSSSCRFPGWAQGQWEQVQVLNNQLSYTDLVSYKTYRVFCLDGPHSGDEGLAAGLMPVFAQSHCGEEAFTCLAVQARSSNVMEFQMGTEGEASYKPGLCESPATRSWGAWLTQGRMDRFLRQSACPVAGEYTGALPDAPFLCAKLYSDCNNPEIMFYTVFSCANRSEVFEEREYRCLGQWSETGVTYTYTERRDVAGYECFAGVVVDDGQIYIMEAGENCIRGLNVMDYGMKLLKQAACLSRPTRPEYRLPTSPSGSRLPTHYHPPATKQQRPPFTPTNTRRPTLTTPVTAGAQTLGATPALYAALIMLAWYSVR